MADDLIEQHLQSQMDMQFAVIPKEKNAMTTTRRIEGKKRAKPGTKGEGDYYRIELRAKERFTTFRYQDVGEKGHIMRLAGQRSSGSWDTQAWLISKTDAHMEGDTLVPDTDDAKKLIETLGSKPKHGKGDVFEAKDRPNISESVKPTDAQKRARLTNIKKAQEARRTRKAKKE
jgi:hypothetical protein